MRWLAFPIALLIGATVVAEPGPKPREVRLDADGDSLPDGALVRLGTKRFRDLTATNITVAADGKSAICWGQDGVRVWDLADGRLLKAWPAPESRSLRGVSADGRVGLTQQEDCMEVWDLPAQKVISRKPIGPWPAYHPVALSPDGMSVAYADRPDFQGVWLWNVKTGGIRTFGFHEYDLTHIQFFGGGRRVLAWTPTGETSCWEVSNGKKLWQEKLSNRPPVGSGDGRLVVAFNRIALGEGVSLLDAATGKPADGVIAPPNFYFGLVGMSDDGRLLAGMDRRIGRVVWDTKEGRVARQLWHGELATFTSDGRSVVAARPVITKLDAFEDKTLAGARWEDGPADAVRQLAWSPDGRTVAARTGYGTAQYLWGSTDGRLLFHQAGKFSFDATTGSTDLARWVAVEMTGPPKFDLQVFARDWQSGKPAEPILALIKREPGMGSIRAALEITEAPHRVRLVVRNHQPLSTVVKDVDWTTGESTVRDTIRLLKADLPVISPNGRLVLESGQVYSVDRLAYDPPLHPVGGRTAEAVILPTASDMLVATALQKLPDAKTGRAQGVGDIAIYERLTGTLVRHIVTDNAWPFALSPDGRNVAALAPDEIRFWDVATGKEIRRHKATIPGARPATSGTALCFSPDGRRLAVGHWDATVLIWDASRPDVNVPPLTRAEVDSLWTDLAAPEAKTGWNAVFRLTDSPTESVPYLMERVTAVKELAAADAARLLADLDSPAFRTRELAAKRAKDWGEPARMVLEAALKGKPGADLHQRLESLAAALSWSHPPGPDELRRLRAMVVLEQAATKEARGKIADLAKGLPGARLTEEARRAEVRLASRKE
jgi:WD40 repeat protein